MSENPTALPEVVGKKDSGSMVNHEQTQVSGNATAGAGGQELRTRIVESLARVRAMPVEDLWGEIVAGGGGCRVDSKEAEVVIVILERAFNRRLVRVEDLEPEEICTVNVLTRLIAERLASPA